jgi:hypothetical protein
MSYVLTVPLSDGTDEQHRSNGAFYLDLSKGLRASCHVCVSQGRGNYSPRRRATPPRRAPVLACGLYEHRNAALRDRRLRLE